MLLRTWLLSGWRPSLLHLPAHDEMEAAGRPGRSGIARHDGLRTPPPPPLPRLPPPLPPQFAHRQGPLPSDATLPLLCQPK